MTREFRLKSASGGAALEFSSLSSRSGQEVFTYLARLSGGGVSAEVEVYDMAPPRWSSFFADLASNWKGWPGEKRYESLEGHVALSCRADSTGHIRVRVCLRGDIGGSDWRAEDTILVEAGQLAAITRQSEIFFGSGAI
jgi:hypothetical protein